MNDTFNIMTSSDDGLIPYIYPQIEAISSNIPDKNIHFFLFHDGRSNKISELSKFCDTYDNIQFSEVIVRESMRYEKLVSYGGKWPAAAYYSICAHHLLPTDIDRILYLDAGDTLLLHEPSDYYWGDFKGKAMTVTSCSGTGDGKLRYYNSDDIFNLSLVPSILRGTFNSGSYVMNLKKMREIGFDIEDYVILAETLSDVLGKKENVYFGDQGLISAAYIGETNVYNRTENPNVWYMPNDFCVPYLFEFQKEPDYEINVIHFSTSHKPWKIEVPDNFVYERDISSMNLGAGTAAFYKYVCLWHEYNRKAQKRINLKDIHHD